MSTSSFVVYAGDGGTGPYAVPFPYLEKSHVSVKVDGVAVGYSWSGDASVLLAAAASVGAAIELRRLTPREPLVDFTDGSILTETDLDTVTLQQLYVSQEAFDSVENVLSIGASGVFDAENKRIENVDSPNGAQDAAIKAYVDAITGADHTAAAEAAQAAAETALTASETAQTLAQAAQAAAEAAAASVPQPPFDTADLSDAVVTTQKIADEAVTFAKLTPLASAGVVGAQTAGAPIEIAAATQAEMEAGTEAALRAMSPVGVAQAISALGSNGPLALQSFNTSGSYTPTSGATKALVFCTGGGGGGSSFQSGGEDYDDNAAGGGAGATAIKLFDLAAFSAETVTIGAGGVQSSGTSGSAGGASSFGTHLTANGGSGGTDSVGGGAGGMSNVAGNPGAGSMGGASFWGGGGRASFSSFGHASAYGAGGGGRYGGRGASGICIIIEF